MSVLQCDRHGCKHIMCDRASQTYGYLCDECFQELCESDLEIAEFMATEKGSMLKGKIRKELLENEFKIREI